jgi:hypothetical protein
MRKTEVKDITVIILWILIAAISRVVPHFPNVTAMTAVSLLAGTQFSRKISLFIVLCALVLSDVLLAYGFGYAVFGSWTLFTYSGFLLIALFGKLAAQKKTIYLFGFIICSSLGFWLWTNFGTWLCSGMYQKSFAGFITCYVAALPFLRNALIGDVIWLAVLISMLHFLKIYLPKQLPQLKAMYKR